MNCDHNDWLTYGTIKLFLDTVIQANPTNFFTCKNIAIPFANQKMRVKQSDVELVSEIFQQQC